MENPITNTINAGCYVFKASVVESIPAESVVSVERQTFPDLVAQGGKVCGFLDNSYWLDIGTPNALLKGSVDLVQSRADTSALTSENVKTHTSQALIMQAAVVDASAVIDQGSCVAHEAIVEAGAHVSASIIEAGAHIGAGARIVDSFIARGAVVASNAQITRSFVTNDEISPIG